MRSRSRRSSRPRGSSSWRRSRPVGPPPAPRISLIVPTWNEAKYLPTLFESLKHQTIPPDEVLIADSGSSDDTPEVARRAGATVVEGERRGPGEGRNRGARAATGNVLVFVDADCILPPIIVETSMRRFRSYGYLRTILQEYVASTILYYATGRSPRELFRPAPAR